MPKRLCSNAKPFPYSTLFPVLTASAEARQILYQILPLSPILIISRRESFLECRIREKTPHLIKDLGALPTRSEQEKESNTERSFAFEHSLLAFSEESRPLVQMVMEETGAYKEHYGDQKRTAATAPALNTLLLAVRPATVFAIVQAGKSRRRPAGAQNAANFWRQTKPFVSGLRRIGREGLGDQILTN